MSQVTGSRSGWRRAATAGALALAMLCVAGPGAASAAAGQAATAAPEATAALPSADEILNKYRAAIGGEPAIKAQTSRHLTGRFEMPAQGMSGPLELLVAAPDRMLLRMELQGLGEILRGFDGTTGWSVDPAVGPRLLQGRELDEIRHSADFYYDARRAGAGMTITVIERADFEGCDCYAVKVVRPSGFELLEYYDAQTGLMAGARMNTTTPMGEVQAVTVLGEYKPFGPLLLPTVINQKAMGIETVLRITGVTFDTVPPAAFAPPPAIQALLK